MSINDLNDTVLDKQIGERDASKLREDVELIDGVYEPFDEQQYKTGEIAPVFFGSGVNNFGVRELLETFIRIQRHIRGKLSSGYDGLAQNYKNLTSNRFNAGTLISAFQSAGDLVQDARTAQKQALVRERMTLSEYNWVKVEVYKSLGVDHVGIDLAEWSDRLNGSGVFSLFGLDYRVSSPPASKNARLVRPFQNELKATAPLALLGM